MKNSKGSSTSTYTLGFNIVEGSVRVLLDGQPLTPGSDYTVDYQVGQVKILKPEALIPGAKVDIDFEKHDFFSFASKTMLGLRGEMNLGKNSFLGFTWLNLNQKTLSDKVRIGVTAPREMPVHRREVAEAIVAKADAVTLASTAGKAGAA